MSSIIHFESLVASGTAIKSNPNYQDVEKGLGNENESKNEQNGEKSERVALRAGADRTDSDFKFTLDEEDRVPFIQKTLSLVGLALFIATMGVAAVMYIDELRMWLAMYALPIMILALFVYLVCAYIMMCCPWIMTGLFGFAIFSIITITMTIFAMMSCLHVDPMLVLMAASFTFIGVMLAVAVATSRKIDLTKYMGVITVVGIIASLFLVVGIIISMVSTVRIVYIIAVGVLIIMLLVYIIVDLQLVLGGKRYQLSPDMYFFGATILFVDIILLFVYILQFIQEVH